MKYVMCKNGHSYDSRIHSACPQCGAKAVEDSGPVDSLLNDDSCAGPTMLVEHSAVNRCIHCMSVLQNGEVEICPHCGQAPQGADQPAFCLRPFSNLHGRYIAGAVLGQGGFGITYVGWDLSLDTRVAIKECYSAVWVTRDHHISNQFQWTAGTAQDEWWDVSCERFLKEARRMAKIKDISGLVRVQDTFRENHTAYIVMDFVEGITLRQWLDHHGQLAPEECVNMLRPMIVTLGSVHKQGFVHRDISPDNIMVQPDGKVRLLDFGAAKELEQGENYQSQLIVKKGYSPIEQYTENGNIGPWTDIYAICATMYFCMTGKTIPTALERREHNVLKIPECNSDQPIPSYIAAALQKGLELDSRKRIQSVDELLGMISPTMHPKRNARMILGRLAAAVLIMVVALFVWKGNHSGVRDPFDPSLSGVEEGYDPEQAAAFREDAERYFSDGEYEKAADCYRQMLARGYLKDAEFGDVLYNIALKAKDAGDFLLCRTLVEEGAEKGSAKAIQELGGWYYDGRGVEGINYEKALSLFRQAAEMGLPSAMYDTGLCYENGYGTEIDETAAFSWYKKSAEAGEVWGMYKVGMCYANGIGTEVDAEKASAWLRKYLATADTYWREAVLAVLEQL